MKRIYLIALSFIFFANLFSQDLCLEKIKDGISKYNAGKYLEAQEAFISVADACGDYGDVYTKLHNCNDKIKQQQTANRNEISTLKSKNKNLSVQIDSLKSKYNDSRNDYAAILGQLMKTKEQLNSTKDELSGTKKQLEKSKSNLASANNTIALLRKDTASLHLKLDSMISRADSLQSSLNKQLHKSGVTVRDDKDKKKEDIVQVQDSVKSVALPIIKKEDAPSTKNKERATSTVKKIS